MPKLELIAALDENNLIGKDGDLPWRLPADLQHFKRLTLGKIVLMGRKTWQSLGRPLPQRENWVITRDAGFEAPGATVFSSLDAALAAGDGLDTIMVIGGAELYRQTLDRADVLHLTRVQARVEGGDTWFPPIPPGFVETAREPHAADERHAYAYSFITLERRG
ncbi:dihydrofolate reductase [Hydrocarboniphaga effusa]|uniref:dihydrofolate reductase n=1 Tax=Hydrocarboniphaga effusa TaxID=243629 RepID=UPI00398C091B